MVQAEIDLTLSDDENGNAATLSPVPGPVTSIKCENVSSLWATSSAAANNSGNDAVNDDDSEGLKPVTTGGRGLWSLWTRNFKSPLLMLLDLVDNAVDAAMEREENEFAGRVQIYRDLYEVMPGQTYTTGLCIRNNAKEIASLKEVLQLFISAKANSGSDSIGENGVGLKQSCAALSDLSFVLVKNGINNFELGIIAKVLQKDDGVYLPCFEFKGVHNGGKTIGQQMLETFAKTKYKEVKECIAEYGKVRSGGNPSVARGIARLSKHFDDMTQKFFDEPFVFEVIVDKVIHRGESSEASGSQDKNDVVRDIINELQHEIPRRYLHLSESLKFCVGKKELAFKHWPERLVEFTKIEVPVRSKIPWSEDFGEMTPDSYHMSIFLGFDRYRIADPETGIRKHKGCTLYIYSRACGRMIQYEADARAILGLSAGGTDFCQALTVIIDDKEGRLPLDPTKQGVAFGNEISGHVHEKNLYAIVSCVVKFYYRYHISKFGSKKTVLTAKIKEFCSSDVPENLKTCRNSNLTDYGIRFNLIKNNCIRVDHTFSIGVEQGPDTIFRLLPDTQNGDKAANGKVPGKRVSKLAPSPKNKQQAVKLRKPPLPGTQTRRNSAKGRAKRKPQVAKVIKQPHKKKQQTRKAPSAKRKQPTGKINNHCGEKKRRTSKTTQLPPKMKGMRSSLRESIGTPPKRYHDHDNSESESESNEDDDESDNDIATGVDNIKTEMESNGCGHDYDPIDLCSSSDEDEESNSSNLSADESEDASEHAATGCRKAKIENTVDGEEPEDQVTSRDALAAASAPSNLLANERESNDVAKKTATDSNRVKEEGEEQAMDRDAPAAAYASTNPLANISEVNNAAGKAATDLNTVKIENTVAKENAPPPENVPHNPLAIESKVDDVAEEAATDSSKLKIENNALKREITEWKDKATVLETKNVSLENEIKRLRIKLQQSKRVISATETRSSNV